MAQLTTNKFFRSYTYVFYLGELPRERKLAPEGGSREREPNGRRPADATMLGNVPTHNQAWRR